MNKFQALHSSFYFIDVGFFLLRNEGKVCKLSTEDNKGRVHVIFRNESVNIPLEREKRRGKKKIWDKKK